MAHWPLRSAPSRVSSTMRVASSVGSVSCTAGAAHVKGAWAEAIASLGADASLLVVRPEDTAVSSANTSSLLDIGIGAAGAEVVVIPNLLVGYVAELASGHMGPVWKFPLFLPQGTRVAIRGQSVVASKVLPVTIDAYQGAPFEGYANLLSDDAIGVNTTTSTGTTVTSGATVDTFGAWVQLVAASANSYSGFVIGIQGNAKTTLAMATTRLEFGLGAAGSEMAMFDLTTRTSTAEFISMFFPDATTLGGLSVPAGQRIAVRSSSTVASFTLDVALHGLRR